ncbi:hypothetical protein BH09MYX1_BH09MYX1_01480 [soil metagenome]
MLPREHGAWAQLALPLLTALGMEVPRSAGLALACSSCALFVLHEPLLVILGLRGSRALREDGARARRWLAVAGAIALVLGVLGIVLGNAASRAALAVPVLLSLVLGAFVRARAERTLGGELVASAALSALALPVALADGVGTERAYGALATWVLAFAATTYVVRGIIAAKARAKLLLAPLLVLSVMAIASRLAIAAALPSASWALVWASMPIGAVTAGAVLAGVSQKKLRVVGWVLAAASASTAALLILLLR